jgi:hypothetical protein
VAVRSLRAPLLLATLTFPTAVLATGFGSDAPTRIPVPAKVFQATVEDVSGTTVSVTRVSFDGEVSLVGRVGEGQVAIPFEKIHSVRIDVAGEASDRIALVSLRDGSSVRVVVDRDTPCYGDAAWGHYRIEVEKLRKITFAH